MKNKKKFISKIVVLLIISVFCLLVVLFNLKSKIKIAEIVDNPIFENEILEDVTENIIADESEQLEEYSNEEIPETIVNEPEGQQLKADSPAEETSQLSTNKSNINENKPKTTVGTTQSLPPTQPQSQIEAQVVEQTENQQTTIQNPIVTQTQPHTQTQNINLQAKDEETFVQNDKMIQEIKKVIEDNETENMKKFGYDIVPDPSIKELTNQFTFYESRVKNYLKYKSGTIRIYAEDCYKNGQFIMTQCYII